MAEIPVNYDSQHSDMMTVINKYLYDKDIATEEQFSSLTIDEKVAEIRKVQKLHSILKAVVRPAWEEDIDGLVRRKIMTRKEADEYNSDCFIEDLVMTVKKSDEYTSD